MGAFINGPTREIREGLGYGRTVDFTIMKVEGRGSPVTLFYKRIKSFLGQLSAVGKGRVAKSMTARSSNSAWQVGDAVVNNTF